jgi:hypothetical protein
MSSGECRLGWGTAAWGGTVMHGAYILTRTFGASRLSLNADLASVEPAQFLP